MANINKYFSAQPTLTKNTSFGYAYNPTAIITGANDITGAFVPLTTDVNGNLAVTIANATISGNLEVDTTSVVNAVTTGNNYLFSILTSGLNWTGNLTGSVTLDLAPMILAQASGNAYLASISGSTKFIQTGTINTAGGGGGSSSSTMITGVTPGVIIGVTGTVASYPTASSNPSNKVPSGAFLFTGAQMITGQALAANSVRNAFFIANISNYAPLYVLLGTGIVSTGSFSIILNPSQVAGYQGGSYSDDRYKGAVSVSGYNFNSWEY